MLNEYNMGEIYIRHAIDELPDEKEFTMHIHDACEIYFFVSGRVEYLVEGSKYNLDRNDLMIIRPAESHTPRILESSRYERYAINFPVSFLSTLDPEYRLLRPFTERTLGKNNLYKSTDLNTELVSKLLYEICYGCEDAYDRALTGKTHLLMLLDMINRAFDKKENADNNPQSLSESVVAYVNKHLFEELRVPALAEHFYLSTSQFGRVFKQATGAAPWDYITKKRLTVAREMIGNGTSAQVVCERCGFGEYSSFYRAYKKHFGCSPKRDNEKE